MRSRWRSPTTIELDDLPPAVRGDYAAAILPSVEAQRYAAGLGKPVRAAGSRAMPGEQARGVSRARHQLSHTPGVLAAAVASGDEPPGREVNEVKTLEATALDH